MTHIDKDSLTNQVISSFEGTPDSRLKLVMTSLVKHIHAFANEVQLTEEEWFKGIQYLTKTGNKCDDKRQEFILLSDVLGLSMLTVAINHNKPEECTEATVFGPFHVANAPHFENGDDVANGAGGAPCQVSGTVKGLNGEPIGNASIDVWQADDEGLYDVQKNGLDKTQARGVLHTRSDGSFNFKSIVAKAYPIPTDGPVGELLRATNRSEWRPAHLHFMIKADGYETLITHVFNRDCTYLDADPVFGVRNTLIADWAPDDSDVSHLQFDFVLNPIK